MGSSQSEVANLGEIFLVPVPVSVVSVGSVVEQTQRAAIDWEYSLIKSKGTGAPPSNMPPGQANLLARRAAVADAYRNLAEGIYVMRVNSDNVVKNYFQNNDALITSISGLVQGSQIVSENKITVSTSMDGYIYEVEAKLPFYGTDSVEKVVADYLVFPNNVSYVPGNGYTGLILDARNLDLKAALHPRIIVENTNQVIYSENVLDRTYLIAEGMAVYTDSMDVAKKHSKAGSNPLIVKAKSVSGSVYKTDIVVESYTAQIILQQDAKSNFLKKGAVVIVL